jgi:excisionase family DNA binding protein
MPDRFITVQEAAEQLRVHPQTVRLWLRAGKLRGRLIGGRKSGYRIPASEIERLLSPDGDPTVGRASSTGLAEKGQ